MDIALKNAYREVNQVIELLGEEYRSKIPSKILKLFNEKQNTQYITNISKDIPIDEIELSRNALVIISILNLRYWETDEDKKAELKNIYSANERKFKEKISVYKQEDWIKTRQSDKLQEENKQEKALVEYKKHSLIERIKKILRNLLSFRKRESK